MAHQHYRKKEFRNEELSSTFDTRQNMAAPDYEIFYYRDANFVPVQFHSHEHYEFYFFLEGAVDYQVGDSVCPMEYGDFLLIPPGVKHRPRFRDTSVLYRRFVLWLSRSFYRRLADASADFAYGFQKAQNSQRFHFHCTPVQAREIQARLIELVQEQGSRAPFCSTSSGLIVASFLILVNRILYEADHQVSPFQKRALCLSLCDYIDNHLEENLSLDSLSGLFSVSKYHIAHVFKENMGIPLHRYITGKRLQASKHDIVAGIPFHRISLRYGFQDYTGYYRAFRKEFGLSPTEFREQNSLLLSPAPQILSMDTYRNCRLCPRQCGADRTVRPGYCGCGSRIRAARAALHLWEEPCISGDLTDGDLTAGADRASANRNGNGHGAGRRTAGSGAVFFSGCTLGCCFCQNYEISHERFGKEISVRRLADIFLRLQEQGACNLNLVTATQYLPSVVAALELVKDRLAIPVVYNCGGYERPEIVRALKQYVDIWLPDLKYMDSRLSARYSRAPDYFRYASRAIVQMVEQTGPPVLDSRGLMRSGVLIRHMVLPGARRDSISLLHWMKENLADGHYLLSLMSQYTPAGAARRSAAPAQAVRTASAQTDPAASSRAGQTAPPSFPELSRRITTYEYESVLNTALDLGMNLGYRQKKSSAKEEYTPPFNLEGL